MTAISLVPFQDRPYVTAARTIRCTRKCSTTTGWQAHRELGDGRRAAVTACGRGQGERAVAERGDDRHPGELASAAGQPFAADGGWLLPAATAGALGVLISRRRQGRRNPLRAAVVLWGGWWLILAVFFSAGTFVDSYYVAALVPTVAALCGTGIATCGPGPAPARVRLIVATTVLGCAGYGAYLMSGTTSSPVVLTVVALVVAATAVAQLLLPASGTGGHLTAVAFAGAAVLLLPAAASVSSVIGGLGPFDAPFESPGTAHYNQMLAAAAPALTRTVQRLELQTPPGDALFGADTSGLAQSYILYSGKEVLPIGGFLGNVPATGAGHAAGRHQPRLRAGIRAAGITAGPGPAGALDRVGLHQRASAPAPPPGPVRGLLLRGPGTGRPAGQPAGQPAGHPAG